MKLIIDEKAVPKRTNCYEIVVHFMEGDADGYEKETFSFPASALEDPVFKAECFDLIRSIQSCINLDRKGRGGFEESYEAAEWYGKGIEYGRKQHTPCYQWSRFCLDSIYYSSHPKPPLDLESVQSNTIFQYYIPTYDQGWYTSYDGMEIFFYDSEGDQHLVEIEYDEEDEKLINYKF